RCRRHPGRSGSELAWALASALGRRRRARGLRWRLSWLEAMPRFLPVVVLPVARLRELLLEPEVTLLVHLVREARAARAHDLAVRARPGLVVALHDAFRARF